VRVTADPWPLSTAHGEVETIIVRPEGTPRFASVYVHGHTFNAIASLPAAWHLAEAGAATLLVTQPGYGRSAGPPDYCGPKTVAAVLAAAQRLVDEGIATGGRIGIWGFSRGAIVSGQAITERPDLFGAAVLQSGGYDLARDLAESRDESFIANVVRETGGEPDALRSRSLIYRVERIGCPLLIIQADDDRTYLKQNTLRLVDELRVQGKGYQLAVVPGEHEQPWDVVAALAVPFLEANLA
jgi:dipeptidyl aminopeptidase/acylaminoacyl peptidase